MQRNIQNFVKGRTELVSYEREILKSLPEDDLSANC